MYQTSCLAPRLSQNRAERALGQWPSATIPLPKNGACVDNWLGCSPGDECGILWKRMRSRSVPQHFVNLVLPVDYGLTGIVSRAPPSSELSLPNCVQSDGPWVGRFCYLGSYVMSLADTPCEMTAGFNQVVNDFIECRTAPGALSL